MVEQVVARSRRHYRDDRRAKLTKSMSFVRRHLAWIVCGWLAGQMAGLAAAPLALCCQSAPAAHDDGQKCCPGLLLGQVCPMHHTREGDRTCKMRSACGPSDAALVALSGGLGVLPPATALVNAFALGDVLGAAAPSAIARAYRPESPPPRA
jgi:hypothetical protein